MCPQLMSAWAVADWGAKSQAGCGWRAMDDAPRRAPSGAPTVRRKIGVDGVRAGGVDGTRTTALSVHSSMHTQHELMATEGFPRLPRQRGHRAERQCRRGRESSELSARLSSEKSLFDLNLKERERSVHHARDELASPFRHLQPHGPVPQRRPAPIVHPQPPFLHRHPLALLLTRRVLRLRQPPKRSRDPP